MLYNLSLCSTGAGHEATDTSSDGMAERSPTWHVVTKGVLTIVNPSQGTGQDRPSLQPA